MRVALIGPSQSGKSTLFAAVAEAGGSNVDIHRPDQPHMAVVKVPDERITWLSDYYKPKKTTLAELEFVDLPGFDLSDEAGRNRARTHWATMRQCDMLVYVVRTFENSSVPAYRNRIDPSSDVEDLLTEMLFADLDQVMNRIEKLEASVKKPTPNRDEQLKELELMKKLRETLEADKPISEAIKNDVEARLIRSFAFLSQKSSLVVLNCSESDLDKQQASQVTNLECLQLSAQIEEEIAQLSEEERKEFMDSYNLTDSARDKLIRACYERLKLASFFTVGEDEVRAWTIPAGTDAVTAAGQIHSDLARGFIRAETISYDEFRQAGDMKAAKAAGKLRLEGKNYIVKDGEILNIRFNV